MIMMVQVPSWSYLNNPASHANTSHLMLKWFNSDLVLRNIRVSTSLKFFKSGKISTLVVAPNLYTENLKKSKNNRNSFLN